MKETVAEPLDISDVLITISPPPNVAKMHPYHYFTQFFSEDLFYHITFQTNIYSLQQTGECVQSTNVEIKKVIGTYLISGVMSVPRYRMYWSAKSRLPVVADSLPQRRFDKLKQFLHFNDNMTADKECDKLYKLRPLIDRIRSNCLAIEPERQHAID